MGRGTKQQCGENTKAEHLCAIDFSGIVWIYAGIFLPPRSSLTSLSSIRGISSLHVLSSANDHTSAPISYKQSERKRRNVRIVLTRSSSGSNNFITSSFNKKFCYFKMGSCAFYIFFFIFNQNVVLPKNFNYYCALSYCPCIY